MSKLYVDEIQPKTTGGVIKTKGHIIQVKNVMNSSLVNGTAAIPWDNTIPQNNEGTEFLTLAITPTSTTSKLKIEVHGFWSCNPVAWLTMALFQDDNANAINASMIIEIGSVNATVYSGTSLVHFMEAGTTSETTFKVRVGASSVSNTTMNGINNVSYFGGAMGSGITIMEIGG